MFQREHFVPVFFSICRDLESRNVCSWNGLTVLNDLLLRGFPA